ncbi:hypothetical protein JB92DRAFT_3052536 [Gautieria morchelliformis]|nr:hypothetical protein JB92DRAFT_3052536 [Gautieria morchelliformis]
MLERNDIQCWVTTNDNILLPEILMSSGETNVVISTVKLPAKKNYVIHWFSKTPLTALCEIHTRSPYGEISKAVATCEMNAAMPWTQRRLSKAHTHSGKNLRFYGHNKSTNLGTAWGTAWLEIRRAKSFSVTEMSNGVKEMKFDRVPSDLGVPYVTFVFHFELIGPEGDNSPSAHQQSTPSGSTQALSLGINNPSSSPAYSLLQTSPGSSSAPCAPSPSSPASDSIGSVPSTSPNPYPFASSSHPVPRASAHGVDIPDRTDMLRSKALHSLRKRPRPDPSPSPPQTDDQSEHSVQDAMTIDDDESYSTKIAGIDMKLGSAIQKLVAIQGKEEYLRTKQEWAQTLSRIRSAELECGSLSPGESFFQNWTSTYDSDEDEDFVSKRGKIELELPLLRKHLSGLGEKIYREKKAKLARLQANIQDAERRCEDLSSNISNTLASAASFCSQASRASRAAQAAALNSTSDCSSNADFWLC